MNINIRLLFAAATLAAALCTSVKAQPPPKGTLCVGDWVYSSPQQMVSCTAVNQDTGQLFTFTEPGSSTAAAASDPPPAGVAVASVAAPSRAPEIDPSGAVGALTLLAGIATIIRARRHRQAASGCRAEGICD